MRHVRFFVEEKWWSDPRRELLESKFPGIATGLMCHAWTLAAWYSRNKKSHDIPISFLQEIKEASFLIEINLIQLNLESNTFYVRGAKKSYPIRSKQNFGTESVRTNGSVGQA